jgi:hypothetical protein
VLGIGTTALGVDPIRAHTVVIIVFMRSICRFLRVKAR